MDMVKGNMLPSSEMTTIKPMYHFIDNAIIAPCLNLWLMKT